MSLRGCYARSHANNIGNIFSVIARCYARRHAYNIGYIFSVIARPSKARPWQSQGCEICNSKTEVISKSLEFNEITTSCASHTPRNDRETSSQINQ